MKLAIMQPYIFPYIGYFQMLDAVDVFVILDDVAYIRGGWINRNFLLVGCKPVRFTVPIKDASSFRSICDTAISDAPWKEKFLKTLFHAYTKAPQFKGVYALAEAVVNRPHVSIAELALDSLKAVTEYLGLPATFRPTSRIYQNQHLTGQDRVLDICQRESATLYVNPPGGRELYDPAAFRARNVELRFVQTGDVSYAQYKCPFVPNLSMLDVLMFNDPAAVREHLRTRSLVA